MDLFKNFSISIANQYIFRTSLGLEDYENTSRALETIVGSSHPYFYAKLLFALKQENSITKSTLVHLDKASDLEYHIFVLLEINQTVPHHNVLFSLTCRKKLLILSSKKILFFFFLYLMILPAAHAYQQTRPQRFKGWCNQRELIRHVIDQSCN